MPCFSCLQTQWQHVTVDKQLCRFGCRAAGEYSLALRCAGDDTLLGGSLMPVRVVPAPVAVSCCQVGLPCICSI